MTHFVHEVLWDQGFRINTLDSGGGEKEERVRLVTRKNQNQNQNQYQYQWLNLIERERIY